jgi:hypothetical protein
VFQIDPETKKKWIPISSQATSVAYYHDSTRNTYRIVSVEENKVCAIEEVLYILVCHSLFCVPVHFYE